MIHSLLTDWKIRILIAAFAIQVFTSGTLYSWVHPEPFVAQKIATDVPSAVRAAGYLSGFRLLVGHLFWIRVIQYYGDIDNSLDRYAKLYDYCSLATDLNPHFIPIYTYGAAALSFHLKRPEQAVKLLQKGILANPSETRLKLIYAAIAYQNTEQYDKMIPFLEAQIQRGDAPEMLVNILANTYTKVGRYQDAVELWKRIIKYSDNQSEQIEAAQKLQSLYQTIRASELKPGSKALR
jgi:pentatricopeptide repeat protein